MKNIWDSIKRLWRNFWQDDEQDCFKYHLSQSDKRDLWYGALLICMFTIAFYGLVSAFVNLRVSQTNSDDVEKIMGTIAAYIGSATEDEYEEIAKTIRNDLVISGYGKELETYIQYIPNTSEECRLCAADFPSQVYLVCTNTGQPYELDLFEKGEDPDDNKNGLGMSFGYDEISETSLYITKVPAQKWGNAVVQRERGIVSVQRMKALFCDDCIFKMLEAVENQPVEEFIIFDAGQRAFYPIAEGTVEIGDYTLQIKYNDGKYEIGIKYTKNG